MCCQPAAAAGRGTPPLGAPIDSFVTTTVFAHRSPNRCWVGEAHTEIAPTRYGRHVGERVDDARHVPDDGRRPVELRAVLVDDPDAPSRTCRSWRRRSPRGARSRRSRSGRARTGAVPQLDPQVARAVPDLGERPRHDEQQDAVHEDRHEPPSHADVRHVAKVPADGWIIVERSVRPVEELDGVDDLDVRAQVAQAGGDLHRAAGVRARDHSARPCRGPRRPSPA